MAERNALAELAERLGKIKTPPTFYLTADDYHRANDDLAKSKQIIEELAKVEEPIRLARGHGKTFTHLADILEASRNRAVEIVRNCRIIAREGGDPCNARDGEGSSLRIGWEGEKEYCVVAKYRQDLQAELGDYDYHRVTGPLTLDVAEHWLAYHKRIRDKSDCPKILVRDVSKWRLFDKIVEEGVGNGK